MNPIGADIQASPQKKLHRYPRLLRIAIWISSGILAILLLVVIAGMIALHTAAFHNYLLHKTTAVASDRLGTRVDIQNFALHFSTLSVDLYGLTVHGTEPYPEPPMLQIQHAEAGVRIVSILRRKWYLDTLRIERPIVNVVTDANGVSNIPKPKSSGGTSNTSIFDLGIRHASLTGGEVSYNDTHRSLAADLQDVEFRATFAPLPQKYSGTLSYRNGSLTAGSTQVSPHNLDAAFDATPSSFHLARATLTSAGSKVAISATLQNYSDPEVQAQYQLVVDGRDVRRILHNSSIPAGLIHATGSMHYHAIPNRPPLSAVVLNGNLNSKELEVQTSSLRTRIYDMAAQYSLANGNATLHFLRARLSGGTFEATGTMNEIGGDSHSEIKASLRGVSLQELRRSLRTAVMPSNVVLTGTLNSQLDAAWGKTLDQLAVQTSATINAQISRSNGGGVSATIVPLNGTVHGSYSNASQQIALRQSYVRTPQTSLEMNGVMSKHSSVALRLQTKDLSEIESITNLFRPAPTPLGLAGTATFNGTLGGSTTAPRLTGQLAASDVHVHGTSWRAIRTGVDVSPSLARLENAVLDPASQGRIALNASAHLRNWSFTNTSPVEITINASQLNITDLTAAIGKQIPVSGVLALNVNMHGTELQPIGQGNLSLSQLTVYSEPVRSAQLIFSGTDDEIHGNLDVSLPAGNLRSTMSARPQAKSYIAQVTADNIRLEKLKTIKSRDLDVNGGVTLHASGKGTFDNPQLDATLESPGLFIREQAIRSLNLQVNLANHFATGNLSSKALNTPIHGNAKLNLSGDYLADATLDTQAIPLQAVAAILVPDQAADLSGETELHATLHGPLKDKKRLEAHLLVPMLRVGYQNNVQLAAASPLHIDWKDNLLSLQRATIRGTDTDLQLQGSIPTAGNAPMSLLLLGTVDLRLAHLFDSDVATSGQLKFNINSFGATHDPNVQGQIEVVDANFATGDLPVGLQHGNGVLTLTRDRLNISKFQGIVGSGTVTAQGSVFYRPKLQFDLGLSGKDIRVLYPQGVRESLNANLRFTGTPENAVFGGAVDIGDISFTPAFDLTNFMNQFSGGVTSPPGTGISQNIQLNLSVHSSNNVNLVSRTLSVSGAANLQVRGTAADPVILGRITLNSGDLIFNGERFVLNGGTIQFVNPSQTQPVVNLALNTTIQEYSINLRFNGPVDQLHTEYASDPSLPAADIINLLAFGKTTEANSANPATPANQQAVSLVASQVSSQVTSRVSKIAGISQLSIDPVLEGGTTQGPPGANVTIQQRVTGNLFVTFTSNLASTQNQTIMGQYNVSPRVRVSATRNQNGGFGFDATIKKTW
jgi:translocation and assembly module TamB